MGQVTIYLDDEIEKKMRAAAQSMHVSQSKWISNVIKEKISDEWPDSIIKLAGAWKDLPAAEEIRNNLDTDAIRKEL